MQLAAEEVEGTRVERFDDFSGVLSVDVMVSLANSGVAGSLVSVSLTGTNGDLLRSFTLSSPTLGLIGTVFDPLAETLTVTASPSVPLAGQSSQPFRIEYLLDDSGQGTHTINVSFQPDCGVPAVCPITSDVWSPIGLSR